MLSFSGIVDLKKKTGLRLSLYILKILHQWTHQEQLGIN